MNKVLHIFDIDETLFTDAETHNSPHYLIKDTTGNIVHRLRRIGGSFELPIGWSISYEEFSSSEKFVLTAKPIKRMIKLINKLAEKNKDIAIVTARANFDDQLQFATFLMKHGIDISKIHVYRVGNSDYPFYLDTAQRKKLQIETLLKDNKYKKCHFYDDNTDNLKAFLSLSFKHKDVELVAHQIIHDKKTEKTKRVKINA